MSCSYDGEYATVWRESTPKARKTHHCDACREAIRPGNRYYRVFSVSSCGDAGETVRCARCELIFRHLQHKFKTHEHDPYDDGPDPELACGHEYKEYWKHDPPPEIAALAFMTQEEASRALDVATARPWEKDTVQAIAEVIG